MKPTELPASVAEFSRAAGPAASGQASGLRRITFAVEAPSGVSARRSYTHPRRIVAIEEQLDLGKLAETPAAKSSEGFEVAVIPSSAVDTLLPQALAWLNPADQPNSKAPISLILKSGASLAWKPNQAILHSAGENADVLLSTLIDFAFLEAELRALEAIVEAREPQAQTDVAIVHRISSRDKAQWPRIGETAEELAAARLSFARLEPLFIQKPKTASAEGRRLFRRLVLKADVLERLESLSFRLEALEDLYGGANDRIADHRGRQFVRTLGFVVIAILVVETIVILAGLFSGKR